MDIELSNLTRNSGLKCAEPGRVPMSMARFGNLRGVDEKDWRSILAPLPWPLGRSGTERT
jgi:hypothetical protein